jgi:imidazole glycerol-phosphate synthase subunit HisH
MGGVRIAVVDYGIGNLRSAEKAFQHVGADARLTASATDIEAADAVVLPGVGAFGACIDALEISGLRDVVVEAAGSGRPFVGICIGLQMLCASSEESPDHLGLAVFDTKVTRIRGDVKLPQMQWNQLRAEGPSHPVLAGLGDAPWMYFVHSFAAERGEATVATCDYGGPVTAVLAREAIVAAQFHPEKSGRDGLAFLSNVVAWAGAVR